MATRCAYELGPGAMEANNVKARVLSYSEIEDRFIKIVAELECRHLDEESIVEKGSLLLFGIGVCISQMKAPDSTSYPDKTKHLAILEKASAAITYKLNTCTVEEVRQQVTTTYQAFGVRADCLWQPSLN